MTNTLCGDPLALSRDPGPTPSVGHVTGDMKRRESNETLSIALLRSKRCSAELPLRAGLIRAV